MKGPGGVHTYREAVVGEKVRDRIAPFGGVGGQGRAAEEARETGCSCDGLGSHIEVLDFQPREPPETVGNLGKEGQEKRGETQGDSVEHLDPAVPEIKPGQFGYRANCLNQSQGLRLWLPEACLEYTLMPQPLLCSLSPVGPTTPPIWPPCPASPGTSVWSPCPSSPGHRSRKLPWRTPFSAPHPHTAESGRFQCPT